MVLAPEHELVAEITTDEQRQAIDAYCKEVAGRSERERVTEAADAAKTGVFTGAYAVNPVNGENVPILDRRLCAGQHYGTGAVFACPGHDERDYAFAKQFDLPIVEGSKGRRSRRGGLYR